jgi:hypothetical protein
MKPSPFKLAVNISAKRRLEKDKKTRRIKRRRKKNK